MSKYNVRFTTTSPDHHVTDVKVAGDDLDIREAVRLAVEKRWGVTACLQEHRERTAGGTRIFGQIMRSSRRKYPFLTSVTGGIYADVTEL